MKRLILALFLVATPAWGQSLTFLRPVTTHTLEIVSTSTAMTTSFGPHIRMVRVHPTENAFLAIGRSTVSVVASTSAITAPVFLPADITEYFLVSPGEFIAVIQDAAAGVVYITEMSR